MFGRWWSRKRDKPLPSVAVPDLDREVAAHWGRRAPLSAPPAPAPPDHSSSLDFGPPSGYRATRNREQSRRRRRLLLSLLVGLVAGPALLAGIFILKTRLSSAMRGTESLGQRLTFGEQDQEEIFYRDGVSEDQARRLGDFLQREGLFGDLRPKSVRLSKNGETFVVGFALEWNACFDQDVADDFRDLLPRLSRGAFDGGAVEIHLCARQPNSNGQPMPTMRVIRADAGP